MKRPPFTRQTAHHQGRDARIFTGPVAWERARLVTDNGAEDYLLGILPPGEDPAGYDWSGFDGREVRIEDYGEEPQIINALAVALILAGALLAVCVRIDGARPPIEVWRPRAQEAAA
jgi:hypothetical protein